ncbi:MAG: transglycosylase SLT domain-containing protein, partial [Armatimonadota bacterium]|nr:transglycosylase SLT domain-containing protein [Armatimonadota bacterium]
MKPRTSRARRRLHVPRGWIVLWLLLAAGTSVIGRWVTDAPQQALRLLGRDVPQPVPARGIPFAEPINRAAARHGLDPALVAAVVAIESNFDPAALSPKGARGLMQVMPQTWPEVAPAACRAPECAFRPDANLDAGARYLRRMLVRFGGDVGLALAAYNAGPEAVARYGRPRYPETERYVRNVSLAWLEMRRGAGFLHPWALSAIRSFEVWQAAFWVGLLACAGVTLAIVRAA